MGILYAPTYTVLQPLTVACNGWRVFRSIAMTALELGIDIVWKWARRLGAMKQEVQSINLVLLVNELPNLLYSASLHARVYCALIKLPSTRRDS